MRISILVSIYSLISAGEPVRKRPRLADVALSTLKNEGNEDGADGEDGNDGEEAVNRPDDMDTHTVTDAEADNPCARVDRGSTCIEGICIGIYWVLEADRVLVRGAPPEDSVLRPMFVNITCESVKNELPVDNQVFDFSLSQGTADDIQALLTGSIGRVGKSFPIISEDRKDLDESVYSLNEYLHGYHRGCLELEVALRAIIRCREYQELRDIVSSHIRSVLHMAPSVHGNTMRLLSDFARLFADFDLTEMPDKRNNLKACYLCLEMGETIPPFSDEAYQQPAWMLGQADPLPDSTQTAEAVTVAERIENFALKTIEFVTAKINSRPNPFHDRAAMNEEIGAFMNLVRTFSFDEEVLRSNTDSHLALFWYYFEVHICKRVGDVTDFILAHDMAHAIFGIPSLLNLCRWSASLSLRIEASYIHALHRRGGRVGGLTRIQVPGHPKDLMLVQSIAQLKRTDLDLLRTFTVAFEGNANLGIFGPRKQWVSEMAEFFFDAKADRLIKIFQFTDASETLITVVPLASRTRPQDEDKFELLRAAGRVIGLALRYDIPLVVPFAPSFLKMLVLMANQPDAQTIDQLLSDEDPAFFSGLTLTTREFLQENPGIIEYNGLGGKKGLVTEDDLDWFLHNTKIQKLFTQYSEAMSAVRDGVIDVVGSIALHVITEQELRDRLCPTAALTPQELLDGIVFREFSQEQESLVNMFREFILRLSPTDVVNFIVFVTGIPRRPVNAGEWIRVFPVPSLGDIHMPRSHTCHNEFQLPIYTSIDAMETNILKGIREGLTIEGHAQYGAVGAPH